MEVLLCPLCEHHWRLRAPIPGLDRTHHSPGKQKGLAGWREDEGQVALKTISG